MLRVLALLAVLAGSARADPRTVQVDYAGACSVDDLTARVRELTGRDPFAPAAATRVVIVVTAGDRPHATLDISDAAMELGRRDLEAASCGELTSAMALVIAMTLDRPLPDPLPEPTPLPAEPVIRTTPTAVAPRPIIVEVLAGIGASHRGTSAGSIAVRVLRRGWSAELGFDLAVPETHAMVDVSRGGATLVACRHFSLVALCPIVTAGWIHGSGRDVATVDSATTPLVSAGGRLAVELQISRRFAVRGRVDGRVLVTSTAFTVDGSDVWTTPRGEAWFGIDLLARIP